MSKNQRTVGILCFLLWIISMSVSQATCTARDDLHVVFADGFETIPPLPVPPTPAAWPWESFDTNVGAGYDYWWASATRAHSGSQSIWCAQVGDHGGTGDPNHEAGIYDFQQDAWLVYGGEAGFSLLDAEVAYLEFYVWYDMEGGTPDCPDYLFYGASLDGYNYTGETICGTSAGEWQLVRLDLTQYAHEGRVYIGFRFHTNITDDNFEGVFIDDVVIMKNLHTPTPTRTPTVTNSPTRTPTQSPTVTLSPTYTSSPTFSPTESPTLSPTSSPTLTATYAPTFSPTDTATQSPTNTPTLTPTPSPTSTPSATPTPLLWILLYTSEDNYRAGDRFVITYEIFNASIIQYELDCYIFVLIGDQAFFHPTYGTDPIPFSIIVPPAHLGPVTFFDFPWPAGTGDGLATFYLAITEPDNIYGIYGYDEAPFSWSEDAPPATATATPTRPAGPTATPTPTGVWYSPTPAGINITVPGDGWMIATGVRLQSGQQVVIEATGEVCFHDFVCADTTVGPNGWPEQCIEDECMSQPLDPGSYHAALIGWTEATGAPFLIGDYYVGAPGSGALFLGINDGVLSDNDGAFYATITP